ncbi:MAG: multidrug effflux MFS transporter [Hyphomicrobiales bacterium]|nr:multidrug effflux MFS transporter [Hyphomicrobiales bacterium]
MRARSFLDRQSPPHIFTLVMMVALSALSMNIFLPSLPSISEHFDEDKNIVQLTITLYLFATAFLQPILGPLSDYYGRRPIVLFGLIGFIVGTVICIFAPNIEILLIGRMVQATSAAGMVISRAIIRDMVGLEKAASMIGYVTMGMAIAPMIGPAMGGYLDEFFGWQAAFWLLLVFAVIVLCITWADLGETRKTAAPNLTSQFASYPILLRSRRFWGYSLTAAASAGTFYSILGGGPFVATEYLKLSPSQFGKYFAIISIGYMFGNYLSGRYAERFGISPLLIYGNVVVAVGVFISFILLMNGSKNALFFFLPLCLVGVGNGLSLPSANAGIVSLHPSLAGAASGLGGFLQIILGATFSMLAGMVLGPLSNPAPMLILMMAIAILGICIAFYVVYIDAQELRKNLNHQTIIGSENE